MNKWLRVALYILVGLIVIVSLGLLYVDIKFEDLLQNKLSKKLSSASGMAHSVALDSADIDIFGTAVQVHGLTISSDSVARNDSTTSKGFALDTRINTIRITGFSVWNYLFNNTIEVNTIGLDNPDLQYQVFDKDSSSAKNDKKGKLKQIKVDSLGLNYPVFTYTSSKGERHHFEFDGLNIGSLLLRTPKDGKLSITNKVGQIRAFTYDPPGGLYHWKIAETNIDMTQGDIVLDSIRLIPNYGKVAMMQHLGQQKTWMDMSIGKVRLRSLNTESLFAENAQIRLKHIEVDRINMDLYADQRFPDVKEYKELPQERFQAISTPIRIDSLTVNSGRIVYEEMRENNEEPGRISFGSLTAKGGNFSNMKDEGDSVASVAITTKFMDQTTLKVRYDFDMLSDQRTININGELAPCKMEIANPMLEHAANLRIQDGENNGLYFNLYLNNDRSTGEVRFLYHGLNIVPLGKDEDAGLLDQLKGFIAESFIIKKHNPSNKDEEPRIGEVSFERIKHKSMFNYSWKSLLSGIHQSLSVPEKMVEKSQEK